MEFNEYLHSKKIDSDAFRKANSSQWNEWKAIFDQMHPKSFTAQKLFLINPLRHAFPYEAPVEVKEKKVGPQKPVMKPKPKEKEEEEKQGSVAKPKMKPKPVMKAKPKIQVKPKVQSKPGSEESTGESKPKFKPKPVIKKRPKTD
ncbi:hypothetical protein GCM10009122_10560 [Fulvivirga kasyanovii]|uniref:Uncharacterized protein n=1 Tax=Fulvivirga kasyanovii TaxID=396812 RepID=A0ABW9RK49_9BACT|nr:hypothetical protein [Fulvivirga kasyanovii]MTI23778.1 hypothetical protein [Fulvivirga kasyanovii]